MVEVLQWLFYVALVGFGLLFGSFANVVIWRFPRGESLAQPGSHCPRCNAPIAWYDNVPVVSWLLLRGRCRSCGAPISIRYPLVEALSGGLWLLAGLRFGMSWTTVTAVLLFYLLLILTYIDIDHQRLPNAVVGALGLIGVGGVIVAQITRLPLVPLVGVTAGGLLGSAAASATAGMLMGGGLSLSIAALYGVVRGRTGLGMGDVKLLGVLGLFLGPYVLMVLMLGSVIGAVYGLAVSHRTGGVAATRIPFGPFLAVAAVVTTVVGPDIWGAYVRLAGLG
jgi:leader peptidase (prepilin peptidase)/N-methyltransferase